MAVLEHPLVFKVPAQTSRDTLRNKPTWFLVAEDDQGRIGVGECSLILGLSPETENVARTMLHDIAAKGWKIKGPCNQNLVPDVKSAIERIDTGFSFVGITEAWALSVCLFHSIFGGSCLPIEFINNRPGHYSRLHEAQRNGTHDHDFWLAVSGHATRAAADAAAAAQRSPSSASHAVTAGLLKFAIGRIDDAGVHLRAAHALRPDHPSALGHQRLGQVEAGRRRHVQRDTDAQIIQRIG